MINTSQIQSFGHSAHTQENYLQRLSPEQLAVVMASGDLVVNACAGSGKTTTLISYAAQKTAEAPPHKPPRILYLAFNRSVRLEAQQRFVQAGLSNVEIHTAHSLAYKHTFKQGGYVLAQGQDLRVSDIIDYCSMRRGNTPKVALSLATHVKKFLSMYCNDGAETITAINYQLRTLGEDKPVRDFVARHHALIMTHAADIFRRMQNRTLPINHDFYLKQFQLNRPRLNYDYILFDEGQDASGSMLAVFFAQNATKVIVGEESQQIYGFRYAINSLGMAHFPHLNLTSSFRFGPEIASFANQTLNWKKIYRPTYCHPLIEGKAIYQPPADGLTSNVLIGRTNLSVLADTIESLCVRGEIGSVYYEGRFDSYTYMDSGGSLLDIYHLATGQLGNIPSPLIRQMGSVETLREYVEATNESSMKLALQIVEKYQDDLPAYIDQIRGAHMPDMQRIYADRIYTTVHRAKGLEYDVVRLAGDFVALPDVLRIGDKLNQSDPAYEHKINSLNEEINMLYVAITRSRNTLVIPPELGLRSTPENRSDKSGNPLLQPEKDERGRGIHHDNT